MVSGRRAGHPVRALKTPFARAYAELEKDLSVTDEQIAAFGAGALKKAVVDGDEEGGSFLCGSVAGLVTKEQTCKEIIEDVVSGAEKLLSSASRRLV